LNIVFCIKALGNQGGGAERVLVDVVSGLAARGHAITVVSSDPQDKMPYYRFDDAIRRINLGIGDTAGKSGWLDTFRRILAFRRTIVGIRPDAVVAFMHSSYLPAGLSLLGTGIPMIASEHIGPEHYRTRFSEWLALQLTPLLAVRITVVTRQILDSFNAWLRRRMVVVVNPVSFTAKKRVVDRQLDPGRERVLLSVGRLAPQKNQKCLIAAFAEIAADFPRWTLRIAGEGELRAELEAQVRQLGLSERVELPGAVSDIGREYDKADLFVLPSTYESFGLATAEAILHGLPAVGFADCPGTNSLIEQDVNGILVAGDDRTRALADTLSRLMSNPAELARLSNAPTDALQRRFNIETVLDAWERLIEEAAKART
jgi:glycosyltransferase involved in cell wall biosynthesis